MCSERVATAVPPVAGATSACPLHLQTSCLVQGVDPHLSRLDRGRSAQAPAIAEFRIPAEYTISGVHIAVELSILTLVAPDVLTADGSRIDLARLRRRPDNLLHHEAVDSSTSRLTPEPVFR